MAIPNPTAHMKRLCKELGAEYTITIIDLEQVIYRDFGNGYNVEVSGMNTSSKKRRATLFLWKGTTEMVKMIEKVPQGDIGDRVMELYYLSVGMIKEETEKR